MSPARVPRPAGGWGYHHGGYRRATDTHRADVWQRPDLAWVWTVVDLPTKAGPLARVAASRDDALIAAGIALETATEEAL